jgi:hypothetical protein
MQLVEIAPTLDDGLLGAACTLGATDVRTRLREWAALRDRSTGIRPIPGGVAMSLDANQPMDRVADLAAREAECCRFYTFTLRLEGQGRELEITAGEGREIAVRTLLGI